MSATGKMSLRINAVETNWDESDRRVEKPCIVCGKKTRGRTWNGGGIKHPACIGCSILNGIDRAKKIYGGAA